MPLADRLALFQMRLALIPKRLPMLFLQFAKFAAMVRFQVFRGPLMALVKIEAGPHIVTAVITRDSVEELGLEPGVPATAFVKATSVMVERDSG